MNITYYLVGLLTGVSVATFFVGKELYKYYMRYMVQRKQLERILKLNDKIKKSKNLKKDNTVIVNNVDLVN
ncbi:hypothetical protein [Flavobacterium cellulosilyticum]|uniref:Uncharacterized protein n=1 Tax=Flavobacterium cellulosilyticum TaxID=2541731 RepID=A0A4R5C970_9FLAO|nr:hypothetical protein [Flavobacterium cellulosilyticum]TDD94693.1 hypothetical protein E0F76_15755 [Flavobacterium cellulosilyticum]